MISKVGHNYHQNAGKEKLALVNGVQGLVNQYNIYSAIGIDAKPPSTHQGTSGSAMLGKDTAAGEEGDRWGEPVGQVGQSRAL